MGVLEQLFIDKFVELAGRPTPAIMDALQSKLRGANELIARLEADNARHRDRDRKADGPLTELWQAADALCKARGTPSSVRVRTERLREAVKAASPFVDQIPF